MHERRRSLQFAVVLAAGASIVGCQGSAPTAESEAPRFAVQRSLVIMPELEADGTDVAPDAYAWELERNDDAQGIGRQSGLAETREIITYTRDRRRTDNGRPREHSRTVTREIRRGTLYVN